jgi:hypothetical protein
MLRAALAEEVLALLTGRSRAQAIAGDLAEEAGRRGPLWFCRALLGTGLALFASALGARRGRMLWLLASGLVCWFAIYLIVRAAGAVAGLQPVVLPIPDAVPRPWPVQVYLAVTLAASGLLAGAALGMRARAHGVNAAAPLAMFWAFAALVLPILDLFAGTATWYCTLFYLFGFPLVYMLPLLAGGALGARVTAARTA